MKDITKDLPKFIKIQDDKNDPKSPFRTFCRPYFVIGSSSLLESARYIEVSEVVEGSVVEEPQVLIHVDFNNKGHIMTRHCMLGKAAMKEIDVKKVKRNPNGYHLIPKDAVNSDYWDEFILSMCVQYEGRQVFVQNEEENRALVDSIIIKNGELEYDKHLFFEVKTVKPNTALAVFVCDESSKREFEREHDKKLASSEKHQYDKLNYIQFYSCTPIGDFTNYVDSKKVKKMREDYLCINGSAVAAHVWQQLVDAVS